MTSFLFPIADLAGGVRSKNDVAPFLSDIARATLDSADALDLFKNLIEGNAGGPESAGFMAFDAHGGEYVYLFVKNFYLSFWILGMYAKSTPRQGSCKR